MAVDTRIIVLASGRGSNFCALSDAISNHTLTNAKIVGVISNKKGALVLKEAEQRNIPTGLIDSKTFSLHGKFQRNEYEKVLITTIESFQPDLILLAGYLLVLGKEVIAHFPNKIINIHPSLLPKFPGLHAQRQALEKGEKVTGCTVHWVTEGLDEGAMILQAKLKILEGDTEATLSERLLPLEHATYIAAVQLLLHSLKH